MRRDAEREAQIRQLRAQNANPQHRRPWGTVVYEWSAEEIDTLLHLLDTERTEVAEWRQRFDRFWEAQMRGVEAWRAAHPGNDLVLPGMAQMTEWMVGEITRLTAALADEKMEHGVLQELLSQPEIDDFLEGIVTEAAHQRQRWGDAHDRDKSAENWFWLVGYLAGKALRAAIEYDQAKAKHHTISAAAALFQWHKTISTSPNGIGTDEDIALKITAEPNNPAPSAASAEKIAERFFPVEFPKRYNLARAIEKVEREAHAAGVMAGKGKSDGPSDEDIAASVKPIWLTVKPSRAAQTIRASLGCEFDDPRWKQWLADFIPEYVWDLVDIAAQRGITAGVVEGSMIAEPERKAIAQSAREQAIGDLGYQRIFDAIAAATRIEAGYISISVKAFLRALSADREPAP